MAVSDSIQYHLRGSDSKLSLRDFEASGIVSRQELHCSFTIRNGDAKTLTLNPHAWTIQGQEGTRSIPVAVTATSEKIKEGEESDVSLRFAPVHARILHQVANLRGDLEPKYCLNLLLTDDEGNAYEEVIHIASKPELYAATVARYGIEKQTTPYTLAGFGEEVFTRVEDNGDQARTFEQVTDNEVLHQGFWMKIFAHHREDTMRITWRFLNQSHAEVQIDQSKLLLLAGQQQHAPVGSNPDIITLPPSGRAQLTLSYPVIRTDEYQLDLAGIYDSGKSSSPVFHRKLLLKKFDIPVNDGTTAN